MPLTTSNDHSSTPPTVLAVDFETYYDRDYSLKKLDAWTYIHHPKFDCYLMSIYGYVVGRAVPTRRLSAPPSRTAGGSPALSAPSSDLCPPSSELFTWAGHPKDFNQWDILNNAILVAHNAAFDSLVFKRLQSLGIIPQFGGSPASVTNPPASPTNYQPTTINWRCTASMSVYLSAPRSLKGACKQLLDIDVDKTQRDNARGQTSAELLDDAHMTAYALEDARLCFLLWDRFNHLWPEEEQELASLTFEWGQYGIVVDFQRLEQSIQSLETQRYAAIELLPWVDNLFIDTPLSHNKLSQECIAAGILCPSSLAMDSPECEAWEEKYGAEYPWVNAMRIYRRTNMLLKRFKTVQARSFIVDDASSFVAPAPLCTAGVSPATPAPPSSFEVPCSEFCGSHRFPYGLKYFGAVPGRWSGDAGFNVQNMPRGELFDVDLRKCFIPAAGNVFIIADLCQIEPRVLAWLTDDIAFLDLVRSGIDIYEAHARSTMGYTDPRPLKEVDSDMRSLAKARTLGLGYGCGPKKFVAVAKNLGGIDITFADAKKIVQDFRSKNLKTSSLWKRLDREFKRSAGGDYHIELPSGRELRYLSVVKNPRGFYTASTERGGRKRKLYGGLLTENLVQATARDVFAEQLLNIHRFLSGVPQVVACEQSKLCLPCRTAGGPPAPSAPPNNHQLPTPNSTRLGRVVFHVHDEVIVEVPESLAEEVRTEILAIMSTTPDWLSGCPIEAEATINHHYTK